MGKKEKKKKIRVDKLNVVFSASGYFLIRVGTFSDDTITTGISFMVGDSCLQRFLVRVVIKCYRYIYINRRPSHTSYILWCFHGMLSND